MKKAIFISFCSIVMFISITMFLSSCSDDFNDGFDAGYNGYTYIGSAGSASDCSSMCSMDGYSNYRYNTDLGNCYCK